MCLWEWVYGGRGRFEEAGVCVLVNLGMGVGGVGVGGWRVCVLFREQSGEPGGRVLGTDRGVDEGL